MVAEVKNDQEDEIWLQGPLGKDAQKSRRTLQNKSGSPKAPETSGVLQAQQRLSGSRLTLSLLARFPPLQSAIADRKMI
jgi:hypothetical protein